MFTGVLVLPSLFRLQAHAVLWSWTFPTSKIPNPIVSVLLKPNWLDREFFLIQKYVVSLRKPFLLHVT
ncbi:hypothetical protein BVRB_3g066700 isoform A [Beta vulgaris subsp. vulgaris]|nr:hypothetical protein BVRB_3g066700 isoform A [Beta vulgaris subsp. vulgaris]